MSLTAITKTSLYIVIILIYIILINIILINIILIYKILIYIILINIILINIILINIILINLCSAHLLRELSSKALQTRIVMYDMNRAVQKQSSERGAVEDLGWKCIFE